MTRQSNGYFKQFDEKSLGLLLNLSDSSYIDRFFKLVESRFTYTDTRKNICW